MKHKVGDIVELRSDLEILKRYDGYSVISQMLREKKLEIIEVHENKYFVKDSPYAFTDDMFVENKKIYISFNKAFVKENIKTKTEKITNIVSIPKNATFTRKDETIDIGNYFFHTEKTFENKFEKNHISLSFPEDWQINLFKKNQEGEYDKIIVTPKELKEALNEANKLYKREHGDYWYVEFNETSNTVNSMKGQTLTKELLEKIKGTDEEMFTSKSVFLKFYFNHRVKGEEVEHRRLDVGDGNIANQKDYEYLFEMLENKYIRKDKEREQELEKRVDIINEIDANGLDAKIKDIDDIFAEPIEESEEEMEI